MSTSTSKRRGPGRPGPDDAADQRQRLLDAALSRYVRDGIAATSLRQIAQDSGVTPALLSYYFGGRDALLEALVEERVLPALQSVRQAIAAAGDDSRALLAALVTAINDAVVSHPWLPTLWLREVLLEGGALRRVMTSRLGPLIPVVIAARMTEAKRQGQLGDGIDPRLAVVSLIGLTLFPAASEILWRKLFDCSDIDAAAKSRHTLALLNHGLFKEPVK